jgi:hypothetical protein
MPFTPFHFGPALTIKAIAPGYFSLTVFILSQVLIDLEPLYFMVIQDPPLHRFFHTYLGASAVFAVCLIIGKPIGQLWLKLWNKTIAPGHHSRLYAQPLISFKATAISSFIGAYTHVFLDSIMHGDMQPLAPWSTNNIMLGVVDLLALHFGLIVLATVGLFWLLLHTLMNRYK